jgi:probable HAF family extracellular repeat protein
MKLLSASIAASSLLAALSNAQTLYTVTDLGNVGVAPGQPFSIANNRLIGGAANATNGVTHAVLWFDSLKGDIGTPGLGGLNSVAFALNARGQAVGQAETTSADPNGEDFCGFKASGLPSLGTTCLPFLWEFGVTTSLPTLGGPNGVANGISDRGVIGGVAENKTMDPTCPAPQRLQFKPVLWEDGQIQELPTFAGDPDGLVWSINRNGQAVGASGDCSTYNGSALTDLLQLHALLWETGVVINLGNLGGTGRGAGNVANSINNSSEVVGNSDLPGDVANHAFRWTQQKGIQDLGTLAGDVNSAAIGLNDAGVIVGLSLDAGFNPRAFLWQDGAMTDLNMLIPADSPLYLLVACSINSQGDIIGFAYDQSTGEVHGYMATPGGAGVVSARKPLVIPAEARKQLRLRLGRFGARITTPH